MPRHKNPDPTDRKTLTIPKEIYDRLVEWKGGERRGISFAEAIDRLVDYAQKTGYKSALVEFKKK
jgi:predicted CopG family antitoxin